MLLRQFSYLRAYFLVANIEWEKDPRSFLKPPLALVALCGSVWLCVASWVGEYRKYFIIKYIKIVTRKIIHLVLYSLFLELC